jgi:transposase
VPKRESKPAVATENVITDAAEVESLRSRNQHLEGELRQVREQLEWLKRQMFGNRSEKLPPQLPGTTSPDLFGNDVPASAPSTVTVPAHERKGAPKAGHGREALPEGLPVEEILLDVSDEEKLCGGCGTELVRIGEDVREELHIVSPRFVVRRYVRPKYVCRVCTERGVTQAPPAIAVIDKGIPSVDLVAWVLLAKYLDHLPLHRVASQFKRWGVEIAESTMIGWIAAVFELLGPIQRAMEHELRTCGCLHADETTLRVQRGDKDKNGRGRTSTGYLWAVLGRNLDGSPVGVSFHYAPGRHHAVAKELLEEVTGVVLTDGYPAYERLFENRPDVVHAACWAHARRKFMDALETGYREANEPLKLIAKLYEANGRIRDLVDWMAKREAGLDRKLSQEAKDLLVVRLRGKHMAPVIDAIVAWNRAAKINALPKGSLGTAIGYLDNQMPRLRLCLEHPRVDLDNNIIERAIRPIAVGRKNWMFAGSDEGAKRSALVMSLVGTCKMLGIDPAEYIADVLLRVKIRHEGNRCRDLTPYQWAIAKR